VYLVEYFNDHANSSDEEKLIFENKGLFSIFLNTKPKNQEKNIRNFGFS